MAGAGSGFNKPHGGRDFGNVRVHIRAEPIRVAIETAPPPAAKVQAVEVFPNTTASSEAA
jgi:hypothetical protein